MLRCPTIFAQVNYPTMRDGNIVYILFRTNHLLLSMLKYNELG